MWKKFTSIFKAKSPIEEKSIKVETPPLVDNSISEPKAETSISHGSTNEKLVTDNKWIPKTKVSLQEALSLIVKNKGINALADPNLCNTLNDFTDYDGERIYRSIFKGIVREDILAHIVSGVNQSIPSKTILDQALYVAVKQCGYNEAGVKYILDILGKELFNTITAEESKVEPEESKVQPEETQIEYKVSKNAVPSFCGIPLGINIINFVSDLEKKRWKLHFNYLQKSTRDYSIDDDIKRRFKKMGLNELPHTSGIRTFEKFSFAGFENAILSIFYTPYTKIVYKVIINLNKNGLLSDLQQIDKVKSLLKLKFGIPSIDNMPDTIDFKKNKSCRLQYMFDNRLILDYRLLHRGCYNAHILMYTTSDLLNIARLEIDKRVDELIQRYEDNKKKELDDMLEDL